MTDDTTSLAPISGGGAAVITGGASGIGSAAARRYLGLGMPVIIADQPGAELQAAEAELSKRGEVIAVGLDVANPADLERLRDVALSKFGHVGILMNNAGMSAPAHGAWTNLVGWSRTLAVNFQGVLHGVHAFLPAMVAAGKPAFVINTGSKQGITNPPGSPAYNVSKAALKTYTEALQHELRGIPGCKVTAHLLVPGFTFTGMSARPAKPPGAWSAEEVVEFMLASLKRGDFYILCPDNETSREMDEKRIQWGTDDLIGNRPALSRWDSDYKEAFAAYMVKPK